jgi:hypothetical protein
MCKSKLILIALIIFAGSITFTGVSHATDYYIAQNSAGGNTGADCADAHAVTWFNTAGNWGSGTGKINPGDTVHLCGTITSALTVQASGTSGNVTTIHFETGAAMTAPYWSTNDGTSPTSGAITINQKNYILVDGGTACGSSNELNCNGTITSTADGTSLANQEQNVGVYINGASNVEIRNLGISNIYLRTGTGTSDNTAAQNSADVWINGSGSSNISVHDCSLTDAHSNVYASFDGGSGNLSDLNIYNNYLAHAGWQIAVVAGDNDMVATGVNIYGNEITNWNNWADANATYHTDGIILYSNGTGGSLTANIHANYFHGDLGGGTGSNAVSTFLCFGGNTIGSAYNNILVNTGAAIYDGLIGIFGYVMPQNGTTIYNNTFVGLSSDSCIYTGGPSGTDPSTTIENNIMQGCSSGIALGNDSWTPITSNHNIFYNVAHIASDNNGSGPPNYVNSLATWQGSPYNQDALSSASNPLLAANYTIPTNSPAVDTGTNLSTYFTTDFIGTARPQSGAWDIGAYEHTSGSDTTPPTVTGFIIPSTSSSLTVPITTLTATDNVGVTGYCVTTTNSSTGCSWSSSAPTSVTFSSAGAQTAYAWAKDAAGNISPSVSASTTITLSTTPPTVTAFALPSTATSKTVPITTFTATDNVGVTGYCVTATNSSTGCSWLSSAPTSIVFGSSGTQTAYGWAKDATGNISTPKSASTTITLPVVNGACGSANGEAFASLSSSSNNLCTSGTVASFSGSGPWTWGCNGSNGGTNTASNACSATLENTTPPVVKAFTLESTCSSLTVPITTFTATDSVGVTGYCVTTTNSSSGCSWEGSAPTSVTFGSTGKKTAYAWAKDAAGNVSSSVSASTTISTTKTSRKHSY